MNNVKALEMLRNGRIAELEKALQDEIYADSLKKKPGAKQRYAAMKRYFKYTSQSRECLTKPCMIEFEGEKVTSFTNSYSLAFTKEDVGEITLFDESKGNYPDVARLVNYDGEQGLIDFNKVFAEAKAKGYKLKANEVHGQSKFYMHYQDAYYKIGLIDITYNIINDGKEATVHKKKGQFEKMTITTDIGTALVLPVRYEAGPEDVVIFA